ncbi:ribosome maturation factor RimM [Sedimentibacter sp. zth1]|uniref:ribosome maturation factor RimM n=1 Tax=Sedimentibacter sp. zth1 TaxID=2816908 RepID=UPI001A9133E3|nr:ribosome maturation factor RimM [Sedimentibacter sp. zth1]QSX06574.1 ribosome maturation factor RimM [Sedimentibacter sp. zth1]
MKDYIKVGKIVNTHGVKGCVKVIALTDDVDRFDELDYVYTEIDNRKRKIENVFYRKGMAFIEFEGITNMVDAEKFKETYVSIEESQLKDLPKDTYYVFELEGLDVYSTEGELIGKVKEVFQTGANDVYEVISKAKTYYIPAIKDVVKEINIEEKKIVINIIEGLLE